MYFIAVMAKLNFQQPLFYSSEYNHESQDLYFKYILLKISI